MISKLKGNKLLDGLVLYGTPILVGITIYFLLSGVLFTNVGFWVGFVTMMALSFAFGFLFSIFYIKKVHGNLKRVDDNPKQEDEED